MQGGELRSDEGKAKAPSRKDKSEERQELAEVEDALGQEEEDAEKLRQDEEDAEKLRLAALRKEVAKLQGEYEEFLQQLKAIDESEKSEVRRERQNQLLKLLRKKSDIESLC